MVEKWVEKCVENGRGPVGMSRGPTSEVEKTIIRCFQKLIKLHEMTGNDQKSAWEHHLGVVTVIFIDLGRPGRSSGIIERDFDVGSQNAKVMRDAKTFCFSKFSKSHEISRNYWKWSETCLGASCGCWNGHFRSGSCMTFMRIPFGARSAAPRALRRRC